jgi:hypothetical protein
MRSRSTLVIELMVLISDTASAPPRWRRATWRMSVMFGVSLTITGSEQWSCTSG